MDKAQSQELLIDAKSVFLNNHKMKEALRIGVEAIDKQIEKKVIWKEGCTFVCPPDCGGTEFDEYGELPYCPSCEQKLEDNHTYKFCLECGQKLNWA